MCSGPQRTNQFRDEADRYWLRGGSRPRAAVRGEPDNRVPLKSHPGHWCYRRAYLKQIEAPWSYRAERQGIENLRTNS